MSGKGLPLNCRSVLSLALVPDELREGEWNGRWGRPVLGVEIRTGLVEINTRKDGFLLAVLVMICKEITNVINSIRSISVSCVKIERDKLTIESLF